MSTAAVELTTLLAEQVELLRTRIPAGVRLEARIPPELPPVEADRGQLSQVVMNLAINAVEAVGEVGAVVVETRVMRFDAAELETFQLNHVVAPGDFVVLGVEDNGPGIDEATLQKIFDPFFTTKFTGRGLGLASVAGIVQSHRGALRVRTRLGEGTRIEVALRLAERRAESERPPALQEPEWKGSGSVLLIDDDDLVRRAIADLLRRLGFEVRAAASGEAGLELYGQAEPRFKLVMLDWIMPGMSGAKVLAELRRLDPELPVILISGYSAEDLASYDARAVCLQKPMTFSVLRSAVRSQLEKHVASNVAEVRLA